MDALFNINKTSIWLNKMLDNNNLAVKDVLYAFYKQNKLYIVRK